MELLVLLIDVIYNVVVEKLELSSRTLNCLKRAGINKVGEVLERTASELLKIRNFGEKSLHELRARLEENDFPVPDSFQEQSGESTELESDPEYPDHDDDPQSSDEVDSVTEDSKGD